METENWVIGVAERREVHELCCVGTTGPVPGRTWNRICLQYPEPLGFRHQAKRLLHVISLGLAAALWRRVYFYPVSQM